MTNDSEDTDDNNKEVINVGLEPLTNDSDGVDESNKESSNDSSKDVIRSMCLSDRVM